MVFNRKETYTYYSYIQLGYKKFGFITRQMEIVISPRFEKASGFKEGLACVKEEKKYGYIDTKGNYIIKPQFDDAGDFYDGLAKVQIEVEM
mgnify:CR=1 FL=1